MQWLSQNAIWLLLVVGLVFLMRRGGMGCGMGGHRHDAGGGHSHQEDSPHDPVTGRPVDRAKALTLTYQGQKYLFESENSRAEFEKNPQQFIQGQTHRHGGGCC